jgi:hypothetical protein
MIYTSNFMKINAGVKATLRFSLGNLRGITIIIGITDGEYLRITLLRWD